MARAAQSRSATAVIVVLSAAGLVAALQSTLVVPLLPIFPHALDISDSATAWLVTISLLAATVATPIVARCADMFGKRRMLIISLSMMVVGSLIAAIGGTFLAVLIGRAFQGFSSALISVAMAILRDAVPREKVPNGAAMISSTMGIGSAMGMPASGALYDAFGWQSVFIASAVAGCLLIIAMLIVLPASVKGTRSRFDVPGALLLSFALTALLLAISQGSTWGWTSPPILLCFAVAIVIGAVWIPWELRTAAPIVNLRMFTLRPILLTNLASLFVGFASYASVLGTIQQLQLPEVTGFGFGLSASVAGLFMIPSSLAMLVFAPLAGRLTTRFGGRLTLIVGTALMVCAYTFRIFVDHTLAWVIIGSIATSSGNAIAYATMPALINASAPADETAAANGLNTLARTIGTATMSAVVGGVLAGVTLEVAGTTLPAHGAFHLLFGIAASSSLIALIATVLLPTHRVHQRHPAATMPTGVTGSQQ